MSLLSSALMDEEVIRFVSRDEVISDECARTIASHWMEPGCTVLSAFVHHFEVSICELWNEVNEQLNDIAMREGASAMYGAKDLFALKSWIEQLTISLGRGI